MKFQFWLVDFELPLAIGASQYCEAVEFWKGKERNFISVSSRSSAEALIGDTVN